MTYSKCPALSKPKKREETTLCNDKMTENHTCIWSQVKSNERLGNGVMINDMHSMSDQKFRRGLKQIEAHCSDQQQIIAVSLLLDLQSTSMYQNQLLCISK